MRSFHTNHSCEDSMHQVPVKIGRPVPDASDSLALNAESSTDGDGPLPKLIFSESSTSKRMSENLLMGTEYITLQKSGLLELERILLLFSRNNLKRLEISNRKSSRKPGVNPMFIHSMEGISRREYSNFRLFGDGSESPLRIHLRNRGREFTHAIPIVPLLRDPAFLGIIYSGKANCPPSTDMINDCICSILQLTLDVENEKSSIEKVSETISSSQKMQQFLRRPRSRDQIRNPVRPKTTAMQMVRAWVNSLGFLNQISKRT